MGEKIGSARKKIDDYLKSHKIETAITPAVSLFGVVEFSLGEVKIDPDPDTWTKIDEAKIEEIVEKTVGISLQEYRELLRSEISSKDISEIKTQIEEIKEYIRTHEDYPFLSTDEFERMQENKFLLKYKNFIGRDDELQELHDFLMGEDKIGFIVGRGGVGKTKLALEFAKQVKATGEWDVYFVNRYADFHPITLNGKTLLILDEAWGYKDKEKIIDFILNRSDGDGMKMVMIDRPISKGSIISDLKRKNVHIDPIELGKGDIALFLRENFEEIGEDKIKDIEEKCEDSFVYASFFAEYLREKGEVGDLKEVLAQRIETYIEDLKDKIGEEQDVIKNSICQISLVTPIDWFNKDREYLEKAFGFRNKYELVDEILDTAYNFPTEFLFYSHNNPKGFLIKPDPVADYLKSEFIKEELCGGWIRQLIPYMPLRLSLNVITISESNDVSKGELFKILGDIWLELNTSGGITPEYFQALVLFTDIFGSMSFFNLDKLNVRRWVECYRSICKSYPEECEIREMLATALAFASNHYMTADDVDKMEGCFEVLRDLASANSEDPEVRKQLVSGLYNASKHYEITGDLDKMEGYVEELRGLVVIQPKDLWVRKCLAMGLANASCRYGTSGDVDKMESYLEELGVLASAHPEDQEIRKRLLMGLINKSNISRTAEDIDKMEGYLEDLRDLATVNPEDLWVRRLLAMVLANASCRYGTSVDVDKMESYLEELRVLATSEDLEVQEFLAMGLANASNRYETVGNVDKVECCLEELGVLASAHPEDSGVRKYLAMGLANASNRYETADNIDKVDCCLEELRTLASAHPEDSEVRKYLAIGLANASNRYETADNIDKVDCCLEELRTLASAHPEDSEVRKCLATGMANALCRYGTAEDVDKMEGYFEELRVIASAHPDNPEIRKCLAMGLYNTLNGYKTAGNVDMVDCFLEELRAIASAHPDNPEIRKCLAMGLYNTSNRYEIAGDVDKREGYFEDLRVLASAHSDDPEVWLVNPLNRYGISNDVDMMEGCLEELRDLACSHPDDLEVRKYLAMGMANASCRYGISDYVDKMEGCLEELRVLASAHPDDSDVRENLATGLVNASCRYGISGDVDKMESCLEYLRVLASAHPDDPEVRKLFATGLYNASDRYAISDDVDKMEGCLEDLRALAAVHPRDLEVRKLLAMELNNVTGVRLKNRKINYEELLLLYKLRFDLPDAKNKQKYIDQIESLLMKTIKNEIEARYEENSDLCDFIDKIKSELEDGNFILLTASEDLPLSLQKLILESLNK